MNSKLKSPEMDRFFRAILSLNTLEECYAFFEDACTVNELITVAQRFEVARLLYNDTKHLDVRLKTGASSATVSRVSRALHYGEDGYTLVLDRLKEQGEDISE